MRKTHNSTFNPKKTVDYCKVFNKHKTIMMEEKQKNEGQIFDPHPQISRFIIDVIVGK